MPSGSGQSNGRRCVLLPVPGGGEPHTLAQAHTGRVAQLAARLVDGMAIVRAEELHAQPGHHGLALRVREPGDPLRGEGRRVQRVVGRAQARRNRWTAAALWTIALLLGWLIYLRVH